MIYPWQQSQWRRADQLIKAGRLPHAIFLQGNQGLGKKAFALTLAHAVLCRQPEADNQPCGHCSACQLLAAGTHPDLHYLEPTAKPNSTSKKPSLSIRIEEIRALCETLNQTSQFGGYRVAVLNEADLLTIAAANSLLKTLEEPGSGVLILLVSARENRLPVTIRSRCQLMRFGVPDESQALQWLKSDAAELCRDDKLLRQAIKRAYGSPLSARNYLQQAEHFQLLSAAMTASISGKSSLDYSAKLMQYPKFQTLEAMSGWVSDLCRITSCGADASIINEAYRDKLQARAKQVNLHRLFRFQDQLNFTIQHASIALNEQLLWDNLLLSWDNM